jgi:hypothetical protein
MSVTTSCRFRSEPGAISSVIPTPMQIEHAEPGGVSWTKRSPSRTVTSTSRWKPAFSV